MLLTESISEARPDIEADRAPIEGLQPDIEADGETIAEVRAVIEKVGEAVEGLRAVIEKVREAIEEVREGFAEEKDDQVSQALTNETPCPTVPSTN